MNHRNELGLGDVEAIVVGAGFAGMAMVRKLRKLAERTLWGACDNWYAGPNVPGKPRVFMLYVDWVSYRQKCEEVVAKGYEGFALA